MLNNIFLQEPTNLSAIYRVTSQAVQLPANNTLSFALLYAGQHISKHRATRFFGRTLFHKFSHDVYLFVFCQLTQNSQLIFYGPDLLIFHIGGFAHI
ncbi:MAG: hypothetical protein WC794_04855 [Candidatus Doudnabacteria bacterium]